MKHTSNKALVISLIKDDLINTKLVNGLNALGLNADDYLLHLSQTVFSLMGYGESEEIEKVFERYMDLSEQALLIDISASNKSLDDLALKIYGELAGLLHS